ncbi:MAG: ATP-binding cassette domain-containing protein [Myxococcaceae bacterium]|nr:MAG: ATP-binding cassette domain-containing protein [Myxococcaceae bacterium]
MTEIFRTEGLSVRFGALAAVDGMDLSIEQGSIHCVIGPNGAGKTTLFNLLTGTIRPSAGRILFRGEDVTGLKPHELARKGIARSFQITSIFPELTVRENLRLAARAGRATDPEARVREVLEEIELASKASVLAGFMSHGDQRHLDIGIALATSPALLLLDEPTAGMPPHETEGTVALVRRLRDQHGYTTILIEHKMDIVMSISDRITVMRSGRKIAEGTPTQVQADPAVREAYLGGVDASLSAKAHQAGAATEPGPPLLTLEGVSTSYGLSQILHDISLTVRGGEIVALLGRNGAGKTTTLRTIMGLLPPRRGTIRFDGHDITRLSPEGVANLGVGLVPEGRRVFANLTVGENLLLPFFMSGVPAVERTSQLRRCFEWFPTLVQRKSNRGDRLSGGEQQMVAIARAVVGRRRFLMLDEPSQGLAPRVVNHLAEIILEIRKQGVTVLLVEQNARMALEIADRAYVLEDGRIVHEDAAAVLRENPAVLGKHLVM